MPLLFAEVLPCRSDDGADEAVMPFWKGSRSGCAAVVTVVVVAMALLRVAAAMAISGEAVKAVEVFFSNLLSPMVPHYQREDVL